MRLCSAARTSGRRRRSADGSPAGTAGGSACSVSAPPRGTGPGGRPRRSVIWFSRATMRCSRTGIPADAFARRTSARAVSSAEAAPPSSRRLKRSYVSWNVARVRREISSSASSSRRSKYADATSATSESSTAAPSFLGREVLRPRRFVQPADAPPDVELPGKEAVRGDLIPGHVSRRGIRRRVDAAHARRVAEIRVIERARDAVAGPRLLDARGGEAHVVAVPERLLDQRAESRVVEDVPPLRVRERRFRGGPGRSVEVLRAREGRGACSPGPRRSPRGRAPRREQGARAGGEALHG